MNKLQFGSYTRITKADARKLYDAGHIVYLCPVNLNPLSPWGLMLTVANDIVGYEGMSFEKVVNAATYYNCNGETGRYLAFYKEDT